MTDAEEIAFLRRELADLRERVGRLEAMKPSATVSATGLAGYTYEPTVCLHSPETTCMSAACPRARRTTTIWSAGGNIGG